LIDTRINKIDVTIACSELGILYDMKKNVEKIDAKTSKKIWKYLFENQNKITNLKQANFDFT